MSHFYPKESTPQKPSRNLHRFAVHAGGTTPKTATVRTETGGHECATCPGSSHRTTPTAGCSAGTASPRLPVALLRKRSGANGMRMNLKLEFKTLCRTSLWWGGSVQPLLKWLQLFKAYGCGSKNRNHNRTLVSGNMDQNLRNPSCLILSHTHISEVPESQPWESLPDAKTSLGKFLQTAQMSPKSDPSTLPLHKKQSAQRAPLMNPRLANLVAAVKRSLSGQKKMPFPGPIPQPLRMSLSLPYQTATAKGHRVSPLGMGIVSSFCAHKVLVVFFAKRRCPSGLQPTLGLGFVPAG